MTYHMQTLEDFPAPVVLNVLDNTFDLGRDIVPSMNQLNDLLARTEGDLIFVIVDQFELQVTLTNAVQALATAFLPREGMHTDQVLSSRVRMLVVGTGTLTEMGINSLRQDQYGNRMLELFPTREAAFEYIRQAVAA